MQQDTATTWSIEGKEESGVTIGLDVGDRYTHVHALGAGGEVVRDQRIRTTALALSSVLGDLPRARVVLEAGPRSPWLSRVVADLGHEVVVANPRQVALIARRQRALPRTQAAHDPPRVPRAGAPGHARRVGLRGVPRAAARGRGAGPPR